MRRTIFTTLLTMFSLAAGAIDQIEVTSIPHRPVVVISDAVVNNPDSSQTVYGPWFTLQLQITNRTKSEYYLNKVTFRITGAQGTYEVTEPIWDAAPIIQPEESAISRSLYIGGLPRMNGTVYSVEATVLGYGGTELKPMQTTFLLTTQ